MRWIDTPLLVYSRVEGHPAKQQIADLLAEEEWASSVLVLLEVHQVLLRQYGQSHLVAAQEVDGLAASSIEWMAADVRQTRSIARERRETGLGGADAALLLLCEEDHGSLFTLDGRLLRIAGERGLTASPLLDRSMIDRVQAWGQQRLPQRGLPRFLRAIERWIAVEEPTTAVRFIEATGGLTRLPV